MGVDVQVTALLVGIELFQIELLVLLLLSVAETPGHFGALAIQMGFGTTAILVLFLRVLVLGTIAIGTLELESDHGTGQWGRTRIGAVKILDGGRIGH